MDGNPVRCRTAIPEGREPRHSLTTPIVFFVAVIGFTVATRGQTQVIPLRSGSGPTGGPDASVRVLVGGTLADSVAAQTASFAVVNGSAIDSTPNIRIDPVARWIRPDCGQDVGLQTVLYAVPFTVNPGALASADLQYVARSDGPAENRRGTELLLNGRPIGEIRAAANGAADEWFVVEDIAPWLTAGINWLHISVPYADLDGGLIFSARVRIWRPAGLTGAAFTDTVNGVAAGTATAGAADGCTGFTCRPRGDLDSDHDVDRDDYYRFRHCFSGPNTELAWDCEYADSECDGDVDLADVASFQAAFTGSW